MSMTSFRFLIFAALTVLLYYVVPKRAQWVVLLVASVIFYATAGGWYLPFILATILSTFLVARLIARSAARDDAYITAHKAELSKDERKAYKTQGKKRRFRMLILGLVFNFGILAVLKYTGFTLRMVNDLLGLFGMTGMRIPSLILPLGISFYTFRTTAYLIDVYRGKCEAATNVAKYALFASFFPTIIQGPICRYGDVAEQLTTPHRVEWTNLSAGLVRVLWGFFKKLVVADTLMASVKMIVGRPESFGGMYVLLLIILYSAVIYGDFTGGIDITIGFSRMLGIRLTENFDHPFSSRSTAEYWNRWHMTMGSYFTDYVFYPLSICKPMQKLTKWSREPRRFKWVNWDSPSHGHEGHDEAHESNRDLVEISEQSIGVSIFLSVITLGLYGIYWQYRLVKNTRSITRNENSCVGEMLCLIFLPFYSLYWWFTRGEVVKKEFAKRNHDPSCSGGVLLVCSILGLSIVSCAIVQNDFNSLPASTQTTQPSAHRRSRLGRAVGMRIPVYLATLFTWFLTGLWHGASWNFIVWGLLNGVVILVSRELEPLYARFRKYAPRLSGSAFWSGFACVRTFFLMGAIRILDCYRDVPLTFRAFGSLFTNFSSWGDLISGELLDRLSLSPASAIAVAVATVIIFFVSRAGKRVSVADRLTTRPILWTLSCVALLLAVLICGSYGIGYDAGAFIYGIF